MDLNIIWFILITVLFTGFFILEGFDYGVGMLLFNRPLNERNQLIRSIGPHWDANEVWMITAGGASFAAFPHFYASMFSTFYIALFLMLLALIMRGVAFELRGKFNSSDWKTFWDGAIIFGSFVPALLWGVATANLLRGLPIDSEMHYLGGFFDLLSPYTILAGVFFVLLFAFHGITFLMMKISDERILLDLRRKSSFAGIATWVAYLLFIIASVFETDVMSKTVGVIIFAAALGVLSSGWQFARAGRQKSAFTCTTVTIAMTTVGLFVALFPRLMVSSLTPEWSLTIYNSASTPHTLTIMTVAAVIFVPIVLAYQFWTYKTFKERISPSNSDAH
ncbi:MAG: cytochrome d ubiquinol oxidase subunit II [Selenomonadaceae bacterium]|nr:cytochrome d ubiquinol oxidase subunit II [Selenomonadaceae bacterium]